ncbi:GNAT family N-acetyltransferase [Bacillus taeanensis]|uniref:GNAT family N-acetyltransferase n=1 Tax=Bacillus taeanensis TaxID=273032 RepID=A0A366XY03_9BACI|nr:GNAT family N-acetyltransferase [Bacillus taeanensis]RBW71022.1 GNAT family N-acetyltransferase [Bacillus taeanensis]
MDQIRILTKNELDEALSLSQFAFQYKLTNEEKARKKDRIKENEVWGYFQNEDLASKLHLLSLQVFIQEVPFYMGGIASVATWPEYRRKGMVKKLLKKVLIKMKENGQTISMLHPFSFPFYRKYGWETFIAYKKYTIDINQIPRSEAADGTIKRIGKNRSLLNEIYTAYAKKYNGMLIRSEEWWKNLIFTQKNHQTVVWYDEEQVPKGYAIYTVKDKRMKVEELIFLNEQARCGLWNFISQHDSMVHTVQLTVPESDQFSFVFENPSFKQEVVPYFMARIIDVKDFLTQYPLKPSRSLFLHVYDEFASWNNGIFHLQNSKNGLLVKHFEKKTEKMACAHPPKRGLQCDIQTLTAMLLGYQRPTFLCEIGKLKGNKEEVAVWEQLISKKTTYFIDFF